MRTRRTRSRAALSLASLPLLPMLPMLGCGAGARPDAPATLAIEHVSVVPMDTARVLPDRTVIVVGDTIAWIGPADRAAVPRGATRIDAHGAYLAPGLMDLHVHPYDAEGLPSYLAHGVTTVFVMHGFPDVLRWRREVEAGRRAGPTIYTTGPTLDGNRPLNSQFVSLDSPDAARDEVAAQRREGYDAVKVYGALEPEVLRAVIAAARAEHLPVFGHINRAAGADSVMSWGQVLIAHEFEFVPTVFGDRPAGDVDSLARRVRLRGATVTPNLLVNRVDRESELDGAAWRRDPGATRASSAAFSEKLPSVARSTPNADPRYAPYLRQLRDFQYAMVRAFRRAGVPLVLGTDTEIYGFAGESALQELEELGRAGLSPFDALATATRDAGRFLRDQGIARTPVGTVTGGSRADLVLLRENPLTTPGTYAHPQGVLASGRWYPLDALKRLVADRARAAVPGRAIAARVDSLMSGGRSGEAVVLLDSALATRGDTAPPLLAEVPLREYARRLADSAPERAAHLRRIAARIYPWSFSARDELTESALDAGDLLGARRENARSLALEPHGARARDLRRLIDVRSHAPTFEPAGRFLVRRASALAGEHPDTVVLERAGAGGWRVRVGTPHGSTAARLRAAGADELWIDLDDFLATEYRLRIHGDSLSGVSVGNFGTGDALRGRRVRGAGTPR